MWEMRISVCVKSPMKSSGCACTTSSISSFRLVLLFTCGGPCMGAASMVVPWPCLKGGGHCHLFHTPWWSTAPIFYGCPGSKQLQTVRMKKSSVTVMSYEQLLETRLILRTSWNKLKPQFFSASKWSKRHARRTCLRQSPLNDPSLLIRSRVTFTKGPWRSNGKGSDCNQCCADDCLTLRWGLSIFLHLRVASGFLTIHATSSVTSIYITCENLNLNLQIYNVILYLTQYCNLN